jgi:hypothetical protein
LRLSNESIEGLIKRLEQEAKGIKDEIFRLSWYMRGGVSSEDLFHIYSYEDRMIINEIVKENIETTKKSGMPIL